MSKGLIQDFAKSYSIETTVREANRVERFADVVPQGKWIYIAHIPGTHLQETVELPPRGSDKKAWSRCLTWRWRIENIARVDGTSGSTCGAGWRPAGADGGRDIPAPLGELKSALEILDSGLLEKHGIRRIGVAGHPEGHKQVSDAALKDALVRKNAFATKTGLDAHIATQFTFSADPVIAWEKNTPEIGQLPVMVGLPGLASPASLLKFALDCGVGASLEAFSKRAASFTKLLTVSAPDDTLIALAQYKAKNPQSRITGVHFFPFGGFKRTAAWINKVVDGQFELSSDGTNSRE